MNSCIMTQYIWRVKTRLPERYKTLCRVIARGKMNSCLVEFEDGYRVVTSRNYLIKSETVQKRLAMRSRKTSGSETREARAL